MKYKKNELVLNENGLTLKCICADFDTAVFGRFFKTKNGGRTSYRTLVAYSNTDNSTDFSQKLNLE